MDPRLHEAYLDHLMESGKDGIIDDAVSEGIGEPSSLEERIIAILRRAGRLPSGWDEKHPQASSGPGQ